jgi:Leucine-rich repeat (LRR) protein
VKGLEKLTQLRELSLSDNPLTDVKGLEKLTKLRQLGLSNNKLTNVKGLEKLTQLTYLRLEGNKLSDVKALAKLTQLETLWLAHFPKKPGLADNPALTKAQIDQLQKALPKCKIYSNYNSGSPEPKTAP